jgi:O-antigen/teichoic acid export membrane protein
MIQALSNIGVSFIAGYLFKWHEGGLIAGLMLSVLVTNVYLSRMAGLPMIFPQILRFELYKKIVNRYRNFLYYSTPLGILNYYTNNILVTVIQVNFGTHMMGLFSNANRLVQTPFSMISSAVSMVFYPHFSRSDRKLRDVLVVFTSLFFVFSLILLPLFFWGEEIIGFYLGTQWTDSALYIRLLFAYFVVSYSVSCISPMFAYIQKEGVVLLWQIALLTASGILLTLLRHNFELSILAYSLLNAFAYIILLLIGVILLKYKVK